MTIQTLPFPVLMPPPLGRTDPLTNLAVTFTTMMTFDGTADRFALVTWIPKTGTITGINFRTGTVSTAGATFQMQIEGVDTSGNPSGTAKYTNSNGTVVVGTGDDNVWKAVAINSGTGVSVTKGDLVALVLTVSSGTPNTVIIAGIPGFVAGAWIYGDMPYLVQDTGGGTWARLASNAATAAIVLDYGGTLEQVPGGAASTSATINAIGNGAERALRFATPWPQRVTGIRARLCNVAAGGDFRARIYSGTTTVLAESINSSTDIDGDVISLATQDNYYDIFFPETPTLAAGTTYYAAIWQKTANAVAILESQVTTTAYMNAFACGAGWYLSARAAGGTGAWTDSTTLRPDISLWVDGFDDGAGAGGGGLIRHPGMAGGTNA